jgi:hypothetical protein
MPELEYAKLLAKGLSKSFSGDFQAEQAGPGLFYDTSIRSAEGEIIFLQHTTSHGESESSANINAIRFAANKKFLPAFEVRYDDWILGAINRKANHRYSNPSNIGLIIEGSIPSPEPEKVVKLKDSISSPFKGVYYVSYPNSKMPAYIVTLEKIWETPAIIYLE